MWAWLRAALGILSVVLPLLVIVFAPPFLAWTCTTLAWNGMRFLNLRGQLHLRWSGVGVIIAILIIAWIGTAPLNSSWTLYVRWYVTAFLVSLMVWGGKTRWRRTLTRSGIIAIGFTTMGLPSPGGGVIFPLAMYYLNLSNVGFEAASMATLVIGVVWIVLSVSLHVLGWILKKSSAENCAEKIPASEGAG